MEAKKELEEEERKKDAERHRDIMFPQAAAAKDRVAAMEEFNRNLFRPVGQSGTRQSRPTAKIQPQEEEDWEEPPSPPLASGGGQGIDDDFDPEADALEFMQERSMSRTLARLPRQRGYNPDRQDDDSDGPPTSPAPPTRPVPPTQAPSVADKGKTKEAKQPQGLISSLFSSSSKKDKQPQWDGSNIWEKPEPSRRYSTWSKTTTNRRDEAEQWGSGDDEPQEETTSSKASGSASASGGGGGISSFFTRNKKKDTLKKKMGGEEQMNPYAPSGSGSGRQDPYADQYGSSPGSWKTQSSTRSDDDDMEVPGPSRPPGYASRR
ncbi:hypothetical protein QBC45DRAFT_394417 [Copromyces sp. CBS 386.78]|nr:hypothetical protein QBC45DRAFT_394417 [Copromyces sp. CBS 386.78]